MMSGKIRHSGYKSMHVVLVSRSCLHSRLSYSTTDHAEHPNYQAPYLDSSNVSTHHPDD